MIALIERCWWDGNTISETRGVLMRAGFPATFEDVRHAFARLSHGHPLQDLAA